MTVLRYFAIECDYCQAESDEANTLAAAKASADDDGWQLGQRRDLCPQCAAVDLEQRLDRSLKVSR